MTRYDPLRHHRRSIRLKGYDYASAGAYFVTMCVHGRECVLGEVVEGEMRLNDFGLAANACWHGLPRHFCNVAVDALIIMPNHIHGIVVLVEGALGKGEAFAVQEPGISGPLPANASPLRPIGTQPGSLGAIIQNFKSIAARKINALRGTPGLQVWQRNYYEHIVRDERELNAIRQYIADNPLKWALDRDNPATACPMAATVDDYLDDL